MKRYKYFRTYHLPWSEEVTSDDKQWSLLDLIDRFKDREIIVTEKLDGENTTIYSDGYCHARSVDSRHHESRSIVKSLAHRIAYRLGDGMRITGENVYAKHSIYYSRLPSSFVVFAVVDGNGVSLAWDEVKALASELGLASVPPLYRGIFDVESIKACSGVPSAYGADEPEGYVVRMAGAFPFAEGHENIAKYVRRGHVQSDAHWMHGPIIRNRLRSD